MQGAACDSSLLGLVEARKGPWKPSGPGSCKPRAYSLLSRLFFMFFGIHQQSATASDCLLLVRYLVFLLSLKPTNCPSLLHCFTF